MNVSALSEFDLFLYHQGTNYHAYEMLGAHFMEKDGRKGVRFSVWAPHAKSVSVVGDFNNWDTRTHTMEKIGDGEIWVTFIEGLEEGEVYKYAIEPQWGGPHIMKADPYGFYAEKKPNTASRLYDLSKYQWNDAAWQERKKTHPSYSNPMLTYEVHLGSWRRTLEGEYLSYRELADQLVSYAKKMNYTHIEVMPLCEHPFDGSWGYQATGYYAVTSRYGEPDDFRYFVDTAHANGIAVIMDWVPGHFCKDEQGLRHFDGMTLYESDHIDGLRIDAVANMLYLNYGRKDGEWQPNKYGDTGNLEAMDFIKKLNEAIFKFHPDALMIAEESTAWPLISKPVYMGGMGFNYKWNMGWMNDMLSYMSLDPIYRKWNQDKVTFSFMYAFSENFVLPLSHDEVVHGKCSLVSKMPGDYWQKFAGLRGFFGYWMAHPGKKLLFMGGEFAQFIEWNYDDSLDWHLVEEYPMHTKMLEYSRALNKFYKENRPFWEVDFDWNGFEWIDCNDSENSIITFVRKADNAADFLVVLCNFTPEVRHDYRIGVPKKGEYREVFNSDAEEFGGSGVKNEGALHTEDVPWHDREQSLVITVPPMATIYLRHKDTLPFVKRSTPEEETEVLVVKGAEKKKEKEPKKPAAEVSDSAQKEAPQAEQSPREAAEGEKAHEEKAASSKTETVKKPSAASQKKPKGGEAKKTAAKARPRKTETAKGAKKSAKPPKKSSKKKAAAQ